MIWLSLLAIATAYGLGSIPFGVVVARARGVDLRTVGSGNIGATNVARALGRPLGIAVFLCDAAKGFLPVLAARWFEARIPHGAFVVAGVGVAAFLGHLTTPFLGGHGGKGVATGFGVFFAIAAGPALLAGATFLAVYALTRVSALGSLAGATVVLPALYFAQVDVAYLLGAAIMWVLIVVRHEENLERLLREDEKSARV